MEIEKNILDLNYQKHLIIASTSIITILTYMIGLAIAFISDQVNLNSKSLIISIVISVIIMSPTMVFFMKSMIKLKEIPIMINRLRYSNTENNIKV